MDSLEFAFSLLSGRRQDSGGAVGGGKTGLYLFFFLIDPNEMIALQLFSVYIDCCDLFCVTPHCI